MNSELSSSLSRRSRFASVGASVAVHVAVIGLAGWLGGSAWEATVPVRRKVAIMVAPRPEPSALRLPPTRLASRVLVSRVQAPPRAVPTDLLPQPAPPVAPTRLPETRAKAVLRIAEAPEISTAAPVLPPALSMPMLAVKPVVQVGLLEGPGSAPRAARRALTGASGTGRASGFDSASGAAPGKREVRMGSGFEGGDAPVAARPRKVTAGAGFDEMEAPAARAAAPKAVSAAFEGLEILEKPRPVYTEEARRLRIEGTVQLRVVFGAGGQIRVVGVVKGLGYGLDEAAKQAAEAIRYRPARRDGQPVDAPAVIQIRFEIA